MHASVQWILTAAELHADMRRRGYPLDAYSKLVGYTPKKIQAMLVGECPVHPRLAWTLYLCDRLPYAIGMTQARRMVQERIGGKVYRVSPGEFVTLRQQWELTQAQMAQFLGYHKTKIAHMEQGVIAVHPRLAFQLALLSACRARLRLWYQLLLARGVE